MLRYCFAPAVVLALLAGGCGSDEKLSVIADWRVRCPESGTGVCASGGPARVVDAQDGDEGVLLDCRTTERAGGGTILNLSIQVATDGGEPGVLELEDFSFQEDGGLSGGRIRVEEGGATFVGAIGADQPCQVTDFGDVTTEDGEGFLVEFVCRDITDPLQLQRVRDVTGTESVAEPATVIVDGCRGL